MQGFKYVAWISRIVSEMSLSTRSHVSEYVWIRNFFFRDSKISTSRRIRIQIGFARPHVSDTYADSLYYPGLLCENWQQSMRRKALEICILLCLERTWERSWHLNYSIHGKELSLILLRHRITKHPDLASTRFRIHGVFKNFLSGERIQKVADSYAGLTGYVWTEAVSGKKRLRIQEYPDTCGRGFKWTYHRLRPLKKESSNQPVSVKVLYFLHKFVKFHDFSMKRVCKLKGRQFPCFMSPGVKENDWINDRRQLEVPTHRLVSSFQEVKANDWKTPGATFLKLKESILGSVPSIDRDPKMYLPHFVQEVLYYVCWSYLRL